MQAERRELAEALKIQERLLPQQIPHIDGWELAVSWQPASGVGGDCFDTIRFGDTRLAISIADVVGKGIPAALLMTIFRRPSAPLRRRWSSRANSAIR